MGQPMVPRASRGRTHPFQRFAVNRHRTSGPSSSLRHCVVVVVLMLLSVGALSLAGPAAGQTRPVRDTVVVPGASYGAGSLRRFLLGAHYRDLWTTPIRVEMLDLQGFAGGLIPIRAHSGSQTTSLRFRGADGRTYQFRSVFKTPAATLPGVFQGTLLADLIQDGASASHPTGALVMSPLMDAVGVLHPKPTLAVMPDDASLGEFREQFAGLLGIVEERPDEADDEGRGGFGSAIKVIGPERLFERIDDGPQDRVDAHAFLTARLMDILVGDRDRHRDNWRWALLDDSGPVRSWVPVSRDHDEAFVKLDGAALGLATAHYPQLVSFGPEYANTLNLNWHAREVDRRFLAGMDRMAWDSTAAWVQDRLTDQVIEDAVRQLPVELFEVDGEELIESLKSRRDGLREEANGYYDLLAREVEIHATNEAEVLEIVRVDDRFVDVSIRATEGGDGVYFHRRFDARETDEVRIGLWGGADRAVVSGDGDAGITLRILGGGGADEFIDSSDAGGVRFYDAGKRTSLEGPRSTLDSRPHDEWIGSDLDRYPPREWGKWARANPWALAGPNFGVLLGASYTITKYGFRKRPYSSQVTLRGGLALGDGWGRVGLEGVFQRENSDTRLEFDIGVSGIDILSYHGLGNDTDSDEAHRLFYVELSQTRLEPRVVFSLGESRELSLGPFARFSRTGSDESPFFESIQDTLYGAGQLGRVGAMAGFTWDTRDHEIAPTRGFRIRAEGQFTPGVWDIDKTFGKVGGEATAFVTATNRVLRPTLALRAGGEKVFGRAPFQEAAYLGGRSNLRGWSSERFAGDASAYGSAELRIRLGNFFFMLPGEVGVFGLADVGRVFVEGDSPGGWHTGFGGGVWFSFLDTRSAISVSMVASEERNAFYMGVGFGF